MHLTNQAVGIQMQTTLITEPSTRQEPCLGTIQYWGLLNPLLKLSGGTVARENKQLAGKLLRVGPRRPRRSHFWPMPGNSRPQALPVRAVDLLDRARTEGSGKDTGG